MDRATKVAVEKYPHGTFDGELGDSLRAACAIGYMHAEKDVWERIEKYLSERNPTDYATVGWILKNIEEYKKKIMEEE